MANRPIQVVIIGGGHFGQKRLQACLDLPEEMQVTGLVEPSRSTRDFINSTHNLNTYSSLEALLNHTKPQAAIIATPNLYHSRLCVQALEHGLHVLCEKPLAINTKEAKKIVTAAKKYRRYVKTGSNHRFFQTVAQAHKLYSQGNIGQVLSFKGSIGNDGSRTNNSWFQDSRLSGGGTFIDNGCHLIDIARMFMGDFDSSLGHISHLTSPKSSVEDYGSGVFVTKDGRQALITSSWNQWSGYLYFEIWGTKGYIFVDSKNHDLLTLGYKNKQKPVKVFDYTLAPHDSYQRELTYFANCLRRRQQPVPTALDGLKVISMIEGVYQSDHKKTWVDLPT